MESKYLKARIKQNNLKKYAGKYFVDESSELINSLKAEGKKALVGIKRKDGVYTIIGENFVYYSTYLGIKGKIPLNTFSDILHENGLKKGKIFTRYNYVKINTEDKIWLNNKSTMSALWNTVLWLERKENKQ